MRGLLFWAAIPWVLPQAAWVRHRAPRFADAAGPKTGAVGHGELSIRLLALGDSIIAGVGADSLDRALVGRFSARWAELSGHRVAWRAIARTGVDTRGIVNQLLDRLPPEPQDVIIVSTGVNDVTGLTRVRAFRQHLNDLLCGLRAHSPGAVIGLAGMPPLGGFPLLPWPLRSLLGLRRDHLDAVMRALAEDFDRVQHVPVRFETLPERFADDGFHPNEASYRQLGQALAEALYTTTS